jgi:nitroreductase
MDFSMPLDQAMETQRSIRRLKPDPVDDEILLRLVDLAIRAPSGSNAQGWEFIIVKDPHIRREIGRLNRRIWGVYRWFARSRVEPDPKRRRMTEAVQWQADHFEEIPVIIVACLRGRYVPFLHLATASYFGSIFPAVQNLLLAARAVNLGAGLITFPLWNVPALRRILGLPRKITPCALIPLGWPLGRYGPTTRKDLRQVVSFDRYGNRPG